MRLRFHQPIINLLGVESRIEFTPRPELADWEHEHTVTLPSAYREWCETNLGLPLLELFSNTDNFYLLDPDLEEDDDWELCVEFMSENQGNFRLSVHLNDSDDPHVLLAGFRGERALYCGRFSDYVFAQIFDWQLFIQSEDPERVAAADISEYFQAQPYRESTFECAFEDDLLNRLAVLPHRGPSTRFRTNDACYAEHRLWAAPDARLRVIVNETQGTALVHVFGAPASGALYAGLKSQFADRITRVVFEPSVEG